MLICFHEWWRGCWRIKLIVFDLICAFGVLFFGLWLVRDFKISVVVLLLVLKYLRSLRSLLGSFFESGLTSVTFFLCCLVAKTFFLRPSILDWRRPLTQLLVLILMLFLCALDVVGLSCRVLKELGSFGNLGIWDDPISIGSARAWPPCLAPCFSHFWVYVDPIVIVPASFVIIPILVEEVTFRIVKAVVSHNEEAILVVVSISVCCRFIHCGGFDTLFTLSVDFWSVSSFVFIRCSIDSRAIVEASSCIHSILVVIESSVIKESALVQDVKTIVIVVAGKLLELFPRELHRTLICLAFGHINLLISLLY